MTQKDRVLSLTLDARVLFVVLLLIGALIVGGSIAVGATPPDPNAPDTAQPPAVAPAESVPMEASDIGSLSPNEMILSGSEAAELLDVEAPDAVADIGGGRNFYLTNFNRAANTALTACTPGYHMASLWEIYDVSNLVYNYAHPNAYTKADSGLSVPSHWYGWVRTGYDSSAANVAGLGNCGAYTSAAGGDYGTILRLNYNWDTSVSAIAPWEPDTWTCAGIAPVWCVGN